MTGRTEDTKDATTLPAGHGPVDRLVRPLSERVRERLQFLVIGASAEWEDTDADLLREQAAEIERLTSVVKNANDQAENFGRLWYLAKEDADRYAFAKTLEGQVVTMETFKVRGAAELDQALDDAMAEDADARNEAWYGA